MVIESYLCRTEGGPGITLSTPLILYMTVLVTSGLPCLGQRSTLNPDVLGQRALYSVVLPVTQHLTCYSYQKFSPLSLHLGHHYSLALFSSCLCLFSSCRSSFFACPLMFISVPERFLTHAVTVLARVCWTTPDSRFTAFSPSLSHFYLTAHCTCWTAAVGTGSVCPPPPPFGRCDCSKHGPFVILEEKRFFSEHHWGGWASVHKTMKTREERRAVGRLPPGWKVKHVKSNFFSYVFMTLSPVSVYC